MPPASALARNQERRGGGELTIALVVDGDLQGLPPTAASHVYRIVQEGLTNIGKHAMASRARVALSLAGSRGHRRMPPRWLALTIEDDGCGGVDRSKATEGEGLGLIGMRERVMALGGRLDIIDLGERGFRLQAMIPFEAPGGSLP